MFIYLISIFWSISFPGNISAYFTYSDCDENCKYLSIACLISENNPEDFSNMCIESDQVCETRASVSQVCLRKAKDPIGGQAIWEDFQKHFHPNVTTTTEKPDKQQNCKTWQITSITTLTMLSIILILTISKRVIPNCTRYSEANYERINDPENPYQQTVEEQDENVQI